MKWKKIALETTTEAADLVCDMLNDLGIEGIEIEDNVPLSEEDKKKMFIDILPELPPDEGKAVVNFYLLRFQLPIKGQGGIKITITCAGVYFFGIERTRLPHIRCPVAKVNHEIVFGNPWQKFVHTLYIPVRIGNN